MAGILFIISAPSGSGKSTIVSQLQTLVGGLDFSISYTTRSPRGSEKNGREYHFTTREAFERMIADGDFLEWAEVFGNYYGTALSALEHAERKGKDLLLDIDVKGAMQVMEKAPEAVSIFIMPPSPQVLEMRLRNRSEAENMTVEDVIERRLREAREELNYVPKYRYAIVNDVLDVAVTEMKSIVQTERGDEGASVSTAETCRTGSPSVKLQTALGTFRLSRG
ncbi:guanylate kinase [Granulicella pectinivorans]|jgi:guanylate kinase|uniref:Guanylate kinase n=1 Tax=Granulicella pectinivorans TaxID=474950 RepID=A0A1I6M805_9BACT|nr:guanylate kinase [Granulicella pectinivorans]SFS11807.1 guanylate kinase [Granulicella pectinivorans]